MTKQTEKNGLQKLMEAFHKRLHRIIEVIDDALNSEQLRDRIWAVEQMLKRVKPEASSGNPPVNKATKKDLEKLSDDELLEAIRNLTQDDSKH